MELAAVRVAARLDHAVRLAEVILAKAVVLAEVLARSVSPRGVNQRLVA